MRATMAMKAAIASLEMTKRLLRLKLGMFVVWGTGRWHKARRRDKMKIAMPKTLKIAGLAIAITFLSHASYAFELSGAWTDTASACGKIFKKNEQGGLSIISGSGIYGDAFIVAGNSIIGNAGRCTINTRKVDGPITHLVATCAAGNVALSTFQFSYRVKDENTIVRIFPGLAELDVTYNRCLF